MNARVNDLQSQPGYRAIKHPRTGNLGIPDDAVRDDAFHGSKHSGQYDTNLSAQVQVQRALEGKDLSALKQALEGNPQLLNGNPVLAEQLRKSEFFQQHRQEIAASLLTNPFDKDAPPTQERQALAAKIDGLSPDGGAREPTAPRQQVAQRDRPQFPTPSGVG